MALTDQFKDIPIDRTFNVPYLAGAAKDGKKVYIDSRLPRRIRVGSKIFDPGLFLRVHEITEWRLMEHEGWNYEKAHKKATQAERDAVEEARINWWLYEKTLNGYINYTEHETEVNPPPDLYLGPYQGDKKELKLIKGVRHVRRG